MSRHFSIDRDEAAHDLRRILPPGSTARIILRHVSGSGMSRAIDVLGPNDEWLSPKVQVVTDGDWWPRYEACKVVGCGMDMGFSLVYDLSATLYGHAQDRRGRMQSPFTFTPAESRQLAAWRRKERGRYASANVSGGYAISHRWL